MFTAITCALTRASSQPTPTIATAVSDHLPCRKVIDMVSIMESNEIRAALQGAERAEAAPWVDYPPTPRWYPLATGIWAAALTISFQIEQSMVRALVVIALVGVELAFIGWYRRYRGTMPSGKAPQEFRPAINRFAFGNVLTASVVVAISLAGLPWLAAVIALLVVTATFTWYERAYAGAAQRARERLG